MPITVEEEGSRAYMEDDGVMSSDGLYDYQLSRGILTPYEGEGEAAPECGEALN